MAHTRNGSRMQADRRRKMLLALPILSCAIAFASVAQAKVPFPRPKPTPPATALSLEMALPSAQIASVSEAVGTVPEAVAPETELTLHPRLLFDARRSALPASWWQVDPDVAVPLMRQGAGVESEYVKRSLGLEVAYRGVGESAPSRFRFDVRTNSIDEDSVHASVGIPLN